MFWHCILNDINLLNKLYIFNIVFVCVCGGDGVMNGVLLVLLGQFGLLRVVSSEFCLTVT